MEAREINSRLLADVEGFCAEILPAGKRIGDEWRAGGVNGDQGKSLAVRLSGPKAGCWIDRADDSMRSNSLVGLYAEVVCGGDFREACLRLGERFGSARPIVRVVPARPKAVPTSACVALESGGFWERWLWERGIRPETARAFGLWQRADGTALAMPRWTGGASAGECVAIKYRPVSKLDIRQETGSQPYLFGKHTVRLDSATLIVAEGEFDAMVWSQAGLPAVSVPQGTQTLTWIELEWDWLQSFDDILLAYDADEPGEKALWAAASRLGMHRCRTLRCEGFKDANDALLAGWTEEDFRRAAREAKHMAPGSLSLFFDDADDLAKDLAEHESDMGGSSTPWPLPWRVRKGELTLFTGFSNHGKSQAALHLAVHLADQGWKALVVSLEIPYRTTRTLMLRLASGKAEPSSQELNALRESDLASQALWNKTGKFQWSDIEEAFRYCAKRYGSNLLVVDSLMMLKVGKEDYDQQAALAASMAALALELDAHVILVAHSRKRPSSSGGESREPGKDDVAGTADLVNLAANAVSWWRDLKTEMALNAARKEGNPHAIIELAAKPTASATLLKQRAGKGKLGKVALHFHEPSGQFVASAKQGSKAYFGLAPEQLELATEPTTPDNPDLSNTF